MTCIAIAKNKNGRIMMAGDRRVSSDWSNAFDLPATSPKIKKDDSGILMGGAGSANLLTILTKVMIPPDRGTEDLDVYMQFKFKDALKKALIISGYKDEHNLLKLDQDGDMGAILVLEHRVFLLDVRHPDEFSQHGNILTGIIEILEGPLPYAVGCGADLAKGALLAEKKRLGYNTRDGLRLAMEIAADISPGCSNQVDIISE